MTTILTVDDSRAMRTIVNKQVRELGFEVHEAEDGEQGLLKLSELDIDLVLLDVTMPVLDGPGMLQRMRSEGRKTPVIMLTSESKRSVVGGVMRMGIDDYILKPFKAEELRQKILTVLGKEAVVAPAAAPAPEAAPGDAGRPSPGPTKQFTDVLVVDDMENVQKRLRALLPERLTLQGATTAQAAVALCRERVFRVILLDFDIPEVNSTTFAGQLRLLQPHAAVLAMALRSSNDFGKGQGLQTHGFDDVLFKPFSQDIIDDFTLQFFDNQEILVTEDNVVSLRPLTGKADRGERYAQRLVQLAPPILTKVVSACYEGVIVDVNQVPTLAERLPKMLVTLVKQAQAVGLSVMVVADPVLQRALAAWDETKDIPCFASVAEARAAQGP